MIFIAFEFRNNIYILGHNGLRSRSHGGRYPGPRRYCLCASTTHYCLWL